ncbi:MAG: NTP transferase domain-containing protein [Elusimicrobiota bacterium]
MSAVAAGIFAAGEGSRLGAAANGGVPKPMALVAGVPLCHWVASGLLRAGAREISVLLNSRGHEAQASLRRAFPGISWTFIVKNTASSWESFRLLSLDLAGRAPRFLLSAVDSLAPPLEVSWFLDAARKSSADAALALTKHVDDEKPLWADVDERGMLSALGAAASARGCATAGLYYLSAARAARMPAADFFGSLREYWTREVEVFGPVSGIVLAKTLDVDRPGDLAQAQEFVKEFA